MTQLLQRILSGTIYVALIIVALYLPTPWMLWGLLTLFGISAIIEFNLLTRIYCQRIFYVVLDCLGLTWLLYATTQYLNSTELSKSIFVPYGFYLLFVLVRSVFADRKTPLKSLSNSIVSQLYIGVPLALAMTLTFPHSSNFYSISYDGHLLLFVFFTIWINDTGAYLVGSMWGRHKLAPMISPSKTIEGAIGGILGSILMGVLFFPWYLGTLLGLVISVMGTIGDLFESQLKRQAGVKDSGKIIPGHGGILDRIDSFLFAVPAVYLLLMLL